LLMNKGSEDIFSTVDGVISNIDNRLEEIKDIRALIGYLRQTVSYLVSVDNCQHRLLSMMDTIQEYEDEEAELRKTIEEERRLKDSVTCPQCGTSFCLHEV